MAHHAVPAKFASSCFGQKHLYVFDWNRENRMTEFVYRLKSDKSLPAWNFYAQMIAFKISQHAEPGLFAGVVPIPGSSSSSVHSEILARELSKLLQLPLCEKLQRAKSANQKSKTALERKAAELFLLKPSGCEEITSEGQSEAKYIFVDDIVTTGQSFKQASELLAPQSHQQRRNIIVSLFYRSKQPS